MFRLVKVGCGKENSIPKGCRVCYGNDYVNFQLIIIRYFLNVKHFYVPEVEFLLNIAYISFLYIFLLYEGYIKGLCCFYSFTFVLDLEFQYHLSIFVITFISTVLYAMHILSKRDQQEK